MSSGRTVNTKRELIFIEMPTSWEGGQDFHLLCNFWSSWRTRRSMFGHCTPGRCAPVNVAHAKEVIIISYPTHIPLFLILAPCIIHKCHKCFCTDLFPPHFTLSNTYLHLQNLKYMLVLRSEQSYMMPTFQRYLEKFMPSEQWFCSQNYSCWAACFLAFPL